jgi:hypothetical protein
MMFHTNKLLVWRAVVFSLLRNFQNDLVGVIIIEVLLHYENSWFISL